MRTDVGSIFVYLCGVCVCVSVDDRPALGRARTPLARAYRRGVGRVAWDLGWQGGAGEVRTDGGSARLEGSGAPARSRSE